MLLNTRNTVCCHFSSRWSDNYDAKAFYANKTWIYSDKSNIHDNMLQLSTHQTVTTTVFRSLIILVMFSMHSLLWLSVSVRSFSAAGLPTIYFFISIHCIYCYSSIQYLCEPCQAITARALPPESPYCLHPPTQLPLPPPAAADSCHLSWEAVCCVSRQRPRRRLLPRKHRRRWTCKRGGGGDKTKKTPQRPAVTVSLFIVATGCAGQQLRCHLLSLESRLTRSHAGRIQALLLKVRRQKRGAVGGAFSSAGKMR